MSFTVADLCRHQLDGAGVMVEQVYIKVGALYAVYRTEERVVIQFADDEAQGADQRKSLSELYVTRGAIDNLLDEMRDARDQSLPDRARRYQRRLADALTLGLQGQTNQARAELDSLKQDLLEVRKSRARQTYLGASLAAGVGLVLLIALLSSPLFNYGLSGTQRVVASSMWFAAAVGTVGAFFSTALAIRNREIEPGISLRDTATDAGLRMFVGALSGALLYALIEARAFSIAIGGANIDGAAPGFSSGGSDWPLLLLIAFVAGFFERFVPDLLAKASVGAVPETKPAMSSRSVAEDAASSELNPLGKATGVALPPPDDAAVAEAAAEDDPEKDVDDCSDRPATPELLTQDVELPEAVGGVQDVPAKV